MAPAGGVNTTEVISVGELNRKPEEMRPIWRTLKAGGAALFLAVTMVACGGSADKAPVSVDAGGEVSTVPNDTSADPYDRTVTCPPNDQESSSYVEHFDVNPGATPNPQAGEPKKRPDPCR